MGSRCCIRRSSGGHPVPLLLESPQGEGGTDGWHAGKKRCGEVKRLVKAQVVFSVTVGLGKKKKKKRNVL